MRLFIAVNFCDECKRELYDLAQRCRKELSAGNPVRLDNFHITLAFLGETQPHTLPALHQAIASVSGFEPFTLTVEEIGRFNRREGDILWADIKGEVLPLAALRRKLCTALSQAGFRFDDQEFRPHMTLIRQAVYRENFTALKSCISYQPIHQRVEKVSLMKSERIGGILTYTEI